MASHFATQVAKWIKLALGMAMSERTINGKVLIVATGEDAADIGASWNGFFEGDVTRLPRIEPWVPADTTAVIGSIPALGAGYSLEDLRLIVNPYSSVIPASAAAQWLQVIARGRNHDEVMLIADASLSLKNVLNIPDRHVTKMSFGTFELQILAFKPNELTVELPTEPVQSNDDIEVTSDFPIQPVPVRKLRQVRRVIGGKWEPVDFAAIKVDDVFQFNNGEGTEWGTVCVAESEPFMPEGMDTPGVHVRTYNHETDPALPSD